MRQQYTEAAALVPQRAMRCWLRSRLLHRTLRRPQHSSNLRQGVRLQKLWNELLYWPAGWTRMRCGRRLRCPLRQCVRVQQHGLDGGRLRRQGCGLLNRNERCCLYSWLGGYGSSGRLVAGRLGMCGALSWHCMLSLSVPSCLGSRMCCCVPDTEHPAPPSRFSTASRRVRWR
jgi:hypothetical protein